jgi:hypothetical protein
LPSTELGVFSFEEQPPSIQTRIFGPGSQYRAHFLCCDQTFAWLYGQGTGRGVGGDFINQQSSDLSKNQGWKEISRPLLPDLCILGLHCQYFSSITRGSGDVTESAQRTSSPSRRSLSYLSNMGMNCTLRTQSAKSCQTHPFSQDRWKNVLCHI